MLIKRNIILSASIVVVIITLTACLTSTYESFGQERGDNYHEPYISIHVLFERIRWFRRFHTSDNFEARFIDLVELYEGRIIVHLTNYSEESIRRFREEVSDSPLIDFVQSGGLPYVGGPPPPPEIQDLWDIIENATIEYWTSVWGHS